MWQSFAIQQSVAPQLIGNKIDKYGISTTPVLTGNRFLGKDEYLTIVSIGALPSKTSKTVSTGISNADYVKIDPTNSLAFNAGAAYPIPYVDPAALGNSITVRLTSNGQNVVVTTAADWSGYSAYIGIRYTKR